MRIFIIDDDLFYGTLLKKQVSKKFGADVHHFTTGESLEKNLHQQPDIITLDYSLPDTNGSLMLDKIKTQLPTTEVIVISGQEDVKTALQLLKSGAYDYLIKDEDTAARLLKIIENIAEKNNLKKQVERLSAQVSEKNAFQKMILGKSKPIQDIFRLMEKACSVNINVSISGPTGAGKELIAKAIHYNSIRKAGPFIAINMSAIPAELLESELFGYEKGAFTGANQRKIGLLEEANEGTLFLDEIAEMSLPLQSKLLRVLQERELVRIGGKEIVKLDFRLIIATHQNLLNLVKQGRFREDLYYRLMGISINLPALKDRENDAILIAQHFLQAFCKENNLSIKSFSSEALKLMATYTWPGNIRELKATVELAAVLSEGSVIEEKDILINNNHSNEEVIKHTNYFAEDKALKDFELEIITEYMQMYKGDVSKVAHTLQISKSKIYILLKQKLISTETYI